ncbi:glycosyltransferase family 2 protein [Algibacter lectus]|uniref:Putative N-acetylgalactosaminyl-diphosphoundecaprenol glucuronosyltransferase n=1 Tax=Algibacter lectus TaxID=221126 RepID=A0A090W1V5_9FLAO|nr:glycosyltransferase family 2 protein [Algibacter lectus]GAL61487.1 putative N-acetylgalactosaminyl-diphosphoundecaprenol glucuronosyltransferase [Algibacter lectus]
MSLPLVSIIIPTYNRAHLISETLDSILAQTYTNWECIVVDDGSTDDTSLIVNKYCTKDLRFIYHKRPSNKKKGANACRNYGFELSKGEYIQFLDSDDLLSSKKLYSQIEQAVKTDADIITCRWGRFTNSDDFKIKESFLYKNYIPAQNLLIDYGSLKSFFPSHVFLVKKEVFFKSGLWHERLKINQDGELFCRVINEANKIVFAEIGYVKYRFANVYKTSDLNSLDKAKDLTKSWKLIERYLKKTDKVKFKNYLSFGKNYAFGVIKESFKFEIVKNSFFYRKQLITFFKQKINKY